MINKKIRNFRSIKVLHLKLFDGPRIKNSPNSQWVNSPLTEYVYILNSSYWCNIKLNLIIWLTKTLKFIQKSLRLHFFLIFQWFIIVVFFINIIKMRIFWLILWINCLILIYLRCHQNNNYKSIIKHVFFMETDASIGLSIVVVILNYL